MILMYLLTERGSAVMDIYCPMCSEPWENDTLHEYAEETGSTYSEVSRAFRTNGCGEAFKTWNITSCHKVTNSRTATMAVLMEIMGDDMDGIVSGMEDAEYMGLLND